MASIDHLRSECNRNGISCRDHKGGFLTKSAMIKRLQWAGASVANWYKYVENIILSGGHVGNVHLTVDEADFTANNIGYHYDRDMDYWMTDDDVKVDHDDIIAHVPVPPEEIQLTAYGVPYIGEYGDPTFPAVNGYELEVDELYNEPEANPPSTICQLTLVRL
jgi:hypothetical protein